MSVKVKEFGIEDMTILPPGPGKCPVCATAHAPEVPHNRDSLYYQMSFRQKHGRFPTWADAMSHCTEEVKAAWTEALSSRGIMPESLSESGKQRMD